MVSGPKEVSGSSGLWMAKLDSVRQVKSKEETLNFIKNTSPGCQKGETLKGIFPRSLRLLGADLWRG